MFPSLEPQIARSERFEAFFFRRKELIGKLRWLKLDDEAQNLENDLRAIVPVERVRLWPVDTD